MKLNYDLIRDLLIYIEEHGDGRKVICSIDIKGYSKEEINYHFIILNEYEYIEDSRLTILGHSYIENIRNKYIWEEIKKDMEIKGIVNTSLDVIKDYANKYIRNKLGI